MVNTLEMTLHLLGYKGVDKNSLLNVPRTTRAFSQGFIPIDRNVNSVDSGNISRSIALPPSSEPKTSSTFAEEGLRLPHGPLQGGKGGDSVVVSPSRSMERPCNFTPFSRSGDRDGCLEVRLGGGLSGCENRGIMVSNGEQGAYQLSGAPSRFLCCQEFHKGPIVCPRETSNGQHFGGGGCESVGRDPLSGPFQSSFSTLVMGFAAQSHSQCGTLCGPPQHHSGLGVSPLQRHQQLALRPSGFSLCHENSGTLREGPFCRQTEQSTSPVFQLEARSNGASLGRTAAGLVSREELRIPSILPHYAFAGQVAGEREES